MAASAHGLARLTLRLERLQLTFRFTYAFHAREVRFERDVGAGFERVFPETFSFHAERHDPAELTLQLDDLARKPSLLAPRANRRDAHLLVARLALGVPRYLEELVARLEAEGELGDKVLVRVHEDVALMAQSFIRFLATLAPDDRPGLQLASFHLRKLIFCSLQKLMRVRVDSDYLERVLTGDADPVDPADDLSDSGLFYTLEGDDQDAVNRSLVRLTERAFYRWLEDVCLDETNRAFEVEESPFADREAEVMGAVACEPGSPIRRTADLSPFLRRARHRDCRRVLEKLAGWFLRQYDVEHAAAMIHHADALDSGRAVTDRVLSRHRTRNYVAALLALASPFLGATVAYASAPRFFDLVCAGELLLAGGVTFWFLLYRFCWRRNLSVFHAAVPRIAAGIIVGFLPIFFIDEIWGFMNRSFPVLAITSALLGLTTLLYLYTEVQGRLRSPELAFARSRQIFLLGLLQAYAAGLIITGLTGGYMASRNWAAGEGAGQLATLRETLPVFVGQLPRVMGVEPFYTFPAAVFVMAFFSFFIGTFLQLMWEDIPITEPL
ncbi:MAG: hypothetical protein JRH16_09255 [Deltaproteobacteria bacterium]|nr:hypothetical protein [Deltaproteobacteria bacterium]MBW2362984.1 hypothetical protein [Deltaproteobacteria bacterium]